MSRTEEGTKRRRERRKDEPPPPPPPPPPSSRHRSGPFCRLPPISPSLAAAQSHSSASSLSAAPILPSTFSHRIAPATILPSLHSIPPGSSLLRVPSNSVKPVCPPSAATSPFRFRQPDATFRPLCRPFTSVPLLRFVSLFR